MWAGIAAVVAACAICGGATAAGEADAASAWNVFGDFGLFKGAVRKTDRGFAAEANGIRVDTEETIGAAGVAHRRTFVRNMSDRPIGMTSLLDVFRFEGCEFEVYTQANTWMNESRGAWQPLHTEVGARCGGMRTSFGAAPMLAVGPATTTAMSLASLGMNVASR